MLPLLGWRGRVAVAVATVALAGCGAVPWATPSKQPHPIVRKPAVSRSDRSTKKPSGSGTPTACPAWLVDDVKVAAAAKLPVPTEQLQGFEAGHVGETAVKAWLGGSSQESVDELLQGWVIQGLSAQRGAEALALFTYTGRHIFPVGSLGTAGTALTLSVPSPTSGERAWIAQDGLPPPPTSGPLQLMVTVDTVVPPGGLAAELGAFLVAAHGNLGSLADMYPVAASAPTGYVTYAGTANPGDYGNLLQGGCTGEPVATTAPDLVSGAVVQMPYWSSTEANAISIGFAPGHVVVESEHAAMMQVAWYAEPAITVPPPA